MPPEVQAALVSSVTVVLILFLKPLISKLFEKKKDVLREDIEINTLVDNKLEEIKETYRANRVWICQFHNGGYYYPTGKSMQKFSMTYEIPSGMNAIQHQFQNIPISLFSRAMDHLSKDNIIAIPDYNEHETYGLDSVGIQSGSKSAYVFPLITIDDRFIGMVGMGFSSKVTLNETEINELKLEVNSIANVLMNEYLNKK